MLDGFKAEDLLEDAKRVLRITGFNFDEEIEDIISAGAHDLRIAGIINIDPEEPLIKRAILTYCRLHFGEPVDPVRLKASYDEQKAQLKTASGFTDWGNDNG